MSGIAGLLRLDGAPVPPEVPVRMGRALAHRGPDASGEWTRGPVGLAHRLRHTTPESLAERQPALSADGALVLVADARLDNRDDLLRRLRPPQPAHAVTDADLLLAAYEAWGEDAPVHLEGDFAFAVWDGRRRRLVCARDALGVRPLYVAHVPGRLFAFASEFAALFAAGVPRRVDEDHLLGFLGGVDDDAEGTFYAGVRRLRPAHVLVVEGQQSHERRYWQLDPERALRLPSDDACADAFLDRFDAAVGARLRSAFPVGTMLSGGLDSSAVTVTARALREADAPLDTFSFVFDGVPASDERAYIEAVVEGGGIRSHVVRGDVLDPFHDLDRVLAHLGEPTGAGNLFLHDAAWAQARAAGVRVMLDGFFGDSAVGYGDERLTELIGRGRVGAWVREARAIARVEGGGRRLALAVALGSLQPLLPHGGWVGTRGRDRGPHDPVFVPLAPRYADRAPRAPARAPRFRTHRAAQAADLASGTYPLVFEVLDKGAAAHGLDLRLPFADRRLVELSLALPSALKLRDGYDRWVLRRGLGGRLPERVRWRAGKADLAPNFVRALATRGRARLAREVEDPAGPLAPYLDRQGVARLLDGLDAGDAGAAARLWTAAVASAWLRVEIGASISDIPDPHELRPLVTADPS